MILLYIFLGFIALFCMSIIISVIVKKTGPSPGPSSSGPSSLVMRSQLTDTPTDYYLQQDAYNPGVMILHEGNNLAKNIVCEDSHGAGSFIGQYKYLDADGSVQTGNITCANQVFSCTDTGGTILDSCCNSWKPTDTSTRFIYSKADARRLKNPNIVDSSGDFISCVEPPADTPPPPPPPKPGNLQGQMVKFWATDYTQPSKNSLVLTKDVCTLIKQNVNNCNDLDYGLTDDNYKKVLKDGEKCIWNGIEGPPGVNVKFYKGTGGGWPDEQWMCDVPDARREYSDVYQGDGFYGWGDREVCAAKFTISDPKQYSCSPSPP